MNPPSLHFCNSVHKSTNLRRNPQSPNKFCKATKCLATNREYVMHVGRRHTKEDRPAKWGENSRSRGASFSVTLLVVQEI